MVITEERKVVALGHSRVIALPLWWVRGHKLNPGDIVIVSNEDGELVLRPVPKPGAGY
jgi:hypothetical protein